MADRHAPGDTPASVRIDADLKPWVAEQKRRGISRSALINAALREKKERDQDAGPRVD